jgi:uncharacterized protein (DUF1800 family)
MKLSAAFGGRVPDFSSLDAPRARLISVALFSAVLSACGGGGGGDAASSSTTSSPSNASTDVMTADTPNARALAVAGTTATWSALASEGGSFNVTGTQTVRYGAGSSWIEKVVTGSGQCTNAYFGRDPIYGSVKACELLAAEAPPPPPPPPPPATGGWTAVAVEGGSFTVSGTQTARYGAGTTWIEMSVTGTGQCTNAYFGRDPLYGVAKGCEVKTGTTPPPPPPPPPPTTCGWTAVAVEGGAFTVSGTQTVRYGAGTTWIEKSVTGSGQCTNGFFGRDPLYGVAKTCEVSSTAPPPPPPPPTAAVTQRDAVRLADQATFGATEALISTIQAQGVSAWIANQLSLKNSSYTSGFGGEIHQSTASGEFCAGKGNNCWRDWYSTQPLIWDFYRNAVNQPDQLRQRVALALQQIVVVNSLEVSGTYGFRNYHNALLDNAFGNYRQVLKKVALSPVMGDFLNNANNDKAAPNENFSRELLQLFALGTCDLNANGSLKGGACMPTYSNEVVRSYAYALTGWTYPAGGASQWGCWPSGLNCRYYGGANGGDMLAVASYHDTAERKLLSGVTVAAGSTAPVALEAVLDSLMRHPNMAPFIGKQLIQHLVSSNPSPAYVGRVASAFSSGKYGSFGSGQNGDLAATVAAVLLDTEARGDSAVRSAGKLREPVHMMAGVLRSLNGKTDGDPMGYWWGENMRQHLFRAGSVFNFYPPDYPVAGTDLVGPTFGIHSANAALERLNFLTYLLEWNGSTPNAEVPNAVGTKADLSAFEVDAADAAKLVDRLSALALGRKLGTAPRDKVIAAVSWWTPSTDATNWKANRVKTAAFLVFGSPDYQVLR